MGFILGEDVLEKSNVSLYSAANRTPDRQTRSLETILTTLYRRNAM